MAVTEPAIASTVLARGSSLDGPGDWALFIGIFAVYLAIGYALEYRSKRRRGARRPTKAAVEGLFTERSGADPLQRFSSRMVMLVGALAAGGAGYATRSAPMAVQIVSVGAVALAGIFAWAYFDHRTESRDET
ncbi:hypothetical protein V2W30_38810 [Streptomyces sp. Q6]|uniref:Uncharacterized protein n=1 Tax=Streptomyces citrinus TaxID=3118173 RepID=A0ACD5ANB6_9ACTN